MPLTTSRLRPITTFEFLNGTTKMRPLAAQAGHGSSVEHIASPPPLGISEPRSLPVPLPLSPPSLRPVGTHSQVGPCCCRGSHLRVVGQSLRVVAALVVTASHMVRCDQQERQVAQLACRGLHSGCSRNQGSFDFELEISSLFS